MPHFLSPSHFKCWDLPSRVSPEKVDATLTPSTATRGPQGASQRASSHDAWPYTPNLQRAQAAGCRSKPARAAWRSARPLSWSALG